ncbi:MAG TPA: MFS transporter [Actinomycetota bacterium]|jgi:DHA3 family tetracycline resistance protein-like MFS transporter|nr:MFS transporter [Actinomycetota bacterium]
MREGASFSERVGILRPLRHRDFRLLWTGMLVSFIGDGIYLVAIAWEVLRLSNVPSALAAVGVAWSIPQTLVVLFSGVLSDRADRRRVMIAGDAIRGVAICAIGFLTVSGAVRLWHIVALVVVYGVGQAIFGPAFSSIVPQLVPGEDLAQANSLDQFVRPFAFQLMGPAIGGVLVGTFDAGWAFLLDAATFAFSIVLIARMHPRPSPRAEHERTSAFADLKEGLSYVLARTWLWGGMFAALVGLMLTWGPFEVLVPFIVKNRLHGSATDLGVVFAVGGVGAVVTAFVWGEAGLPRRPMTVLYLSWSVAAFAIAGFGVVTAVWQAALVAAVEAAGITTLLVMWFTVVQRHVPGEILGRVSSLDWMISAGLIPVSFALTGPVASAIGAKATLLLAGIGGGTVILATMVFLPGVLDPEREGFTT